MAYLLRSSKEASMLLYFLRYEKRTHLFKDRLEKIVTHMKLIYLQVLILKVLGNETWHMLYK